MKRLAGTLVLGCMLLSTNSVSAAVGTGPGDFVPVEGGKIYYETCGSGPEAVMLIHDGVLHSAGFDAVWPLLCKRYRVVRYDRRGYGRSAAASAPYAPTDDIGAVMRAADVAHATVVGASEGGGLAINFTLQHPEKVDRLVLVGPAVSGFAVSEHFINRSKAVIAALRQGGVAEALNDRYWMAPDHEEARRQALALLLANPQNIVHPNDPQKPSPPARPQLGAIRTPTLILVGEDDIADVQGWAGALEALIAGSKRLVIPDAGHLLYVERPDAFVDQLVAFIAKPQPAGPS